MLHLSFFSSVIHSIVIFLKKKKKTKIMKKKPTFIGEEVENTLINS